MRVRSLLFSIAAILLASSAASAANDATLDRDWLASMTRPAEIVAVVDRATQKMTVSIDGVIAESWDVSTGRSLNSTRAGTFHPTSPPEFVHYSHKYHHAPMYFAVFFDGNRAVHGIPASEVPLLGTRASHGCVRLETANAEMFYYLVRINGLDHTTIIIK